MLISDKKEITGRELWELTSENEKLEHRISELDTILNKLYEDYALEKISETQYRSMIEAYESERNEKDKLLSENNKKAERSREEKINADNNYNNYITP